MRQRLRESQGGVETEETEHKEEKGRLKAKRAKQQKRHRENPKTTGWFGCGNPLRAEWWHHGALTILALNVEGKIEVGDMLEACSAVRAMAFLGSEMGMMKDYSGLNSESLWDAHMMATEWRLWKSPGKHTGTCVALHETWASRVTQCEVDPEGRFTILRLDARGGRPLILGSVYGVVSPTLRANREQARRLIQRVDEAVRRLVDNDVDPQVVIGGDYNLPPGEAYTPHKWSTEHRAQRAAWDNVGGQRLVDAFTTKYPMEAIPKVYSFRMESGQSLIDGFMVSSGLSAAIRAVGIEIDKTATPTKHRAVVLTLNAVELLGIAPERRRPVPGGVRKSRRAPPTRDLQGEIRLNKLRDKLLEKDEPLLAETASAEREGAALLKGKLKFDRAKREELWDVYVAKAMAEIAEHLRPMPGTEEQGNPLYQGELVLDQAELEAIRCNQQKAMAGALRFHGEKEAMTAQLTGMDAEEATERESRFKTVADRTCDASGPEFRQANKPSSGVFIKGRGFYKLRRETRSLRNLAGQIQRWLWGNDLDGVASQGEKRRLELKAHLKFGVEGPKQASVEGWEEWRLTINLALKAKQGEFQQEIGRQRRRQIAAATKERKERFKMSEVKGDITQMIRSVLRKKTPKTPKGGAWVMSNSGGTKLFFSTDPMYDLSEARDTFYRWTYSPCRAAFPECNEDFPWEHRIFK